jgi:hypothetical protein
MTPTLAAIVAVGVLAAAGALPVWCLSGRRLVAFPLMPLAGSVIGAVAATCSIVIAGTLLQWFVGWSVMVATVALVIMWRRRWGQSIATHTPRLQVRPLTVGAALLLLGVVAWTLRTAQVPNVGFDTRAIWLLHARWLTHGHAFAHSAIVNPFLILSHPGYPPLVSGAMALSWQLSGDGSDRVAVITVALLNACALFVAAWGLVEAARRGAARLEIGQYRRRFIIGMGVLIAALAILVTGGVLGTFDTNGYADPLWSLAAVGAVVWGLSLPPTMSSIGVSVILVLVAGMTKVEGIAVAMIIVVVLTARLYGYGRRRRRLLLAGFAGLVTLLVWPLATLAMGVPNDPSLRGSREGSLLDRAQRAMSAAAPHLEVVLLAVGCGVIGFLFLREVRQRLGLGNDLWAWAALGGAILVLGGAYVFGPGNVQLWLDTSVDRTTIFVALLGWWIVAVWAVCGASASLTKGAVT